MEWAAIILAFVAGACLGLVVASLLVMAHDAEPDTLTDIEHRIAGD
jgi:hypothetical protein